MIKARKRRVAALAAVAVSTGLFAAAPSAVADNGAASRSYQQNNLVSDIPGLAAHTDPNLRNSWGTSTGPGLPIWVSDNATGKATLYDGQGNPQPSPGKQQLAVSIPAPPSAGAGAVGAPDGTVFNTASSGFVISKDGVSAPSRFLFATEDGTIVGWNPAVDPTHAVIAVDRSTATDPAGDRGAVYKGLALVFTPAGNFLYATNFRFGTVEVFDSNFNLVNTFTDPTVPAGFAPFGIHNIGGDLFVTFAKQDAAKFDDDAGPGHGFVDVFAPNGDLLQRLASRGKLDSPWGVTLAPSYLRGLWRRHPGRQLRERAHQRLRTLHRPVPRPAEDQPWSSQDPRAVGAALPDRFTQRRARRPLLHGRPQSRG